LQGILAELNSHPCASLNSHQRSAADSSTHSDTSNAKLTHSA
jgi:hypothetical protein